MSVSTISEPVSLSAAAENLVLPMVGIGILNWNGRAFLEQFLPFLYQISYESVRLYVIDNASSDDSISYLTTHHPNVRIIQTGGNYGVPGGYNRGFAQMAEPYLLMLNSDVEVAPGFLEPLVALMEARHNVAMVQSTLMAHGQRHLYEYGGAAGGMMDVLGYSFCRGRIFSTVEHNEGQYPSAPVFWAGGACALIRKTAYDAVGGMYEWYFMHFEEIDLCWRFQSAGLEVWSSSQSVAWHVGGGTLSYQSPQKTYYNFKNNLVMVVRNSPWWYLLFWLPVRLGLDVVAALVFAAKFDWANAKAVARGWWGFLGWWWRAKSSDFPFQKVALTELPTSLKSSMVVGYFLQKKHCASQYKAVKISNP